MLAPEYIVQSSGKTHNTCKQKKIFELIQKLFSFIDFIVLCIYDFLSIKRGTINREGQLKANYWGKCKFLVNMWFGVN